MSFLDQVWSLCKSAFALLSPGEDCWILEWFRAVLCGFPLLRNRPYVYIYCIYHIRPCRQIRRGCQVYEAFSIRSSCLAGLRPLRLLVANTWSCAIKALTSCMGYIGPPRAVVIVLPSSYISKNNHKQTCVCSSEITRRCENDMAPIICPGFWWQKLCKDVVR